MISKTRKTTRLHKKGTLFVISAPSGTGKTTLCNRLIRKMPDLRLSVSYTTRPPRKGEVNDVHYSFVSEKKFKGMIDRGEFAEWAIVHGNMYGTSIKRLKKMNREGYDIILDIDVHGALQIRKSYENAVYIFILPPSMSILKQRLIGRRTDSAETVLERLDNARAEIANYKNYDYIVVNDNIEEAYRDLKSIIISTNLKTASFDIRRLNNLMN